MAKEGGKPVIHVRRPRPAQYRRHNHPQGAFDVSLRFTLYFLAVPSTLITFVSALLGVAIKVPILEAQPKKHCHSKSSLDLAVYRGYDPDLGRWLSRDPLENAELSQGPNLYAYVGNNPVNLADPLGLYYALAPWTWFDGSGYEGTGASFYRGSDFDEGAYAKRKRGQS